MSPNAAQLRSLVKYERYLSTVAALLNLSHTDNDEDPIVLTSGRSWLKTRNLDTARLFNARALTKRDNSKKKTQPRTRPDSGSAARLKQVSLKSRERVLKKAKP